MLKNRLFGLLLLAAFIFSTTALLAQAKPQDKKAQDKKGVELVEPVKVEKPKGKEKIMIYNGEYLKVQLYGFVKMDMVYNTTNVFNESGPFRVENQVTFLNPLAAGAATLLLPAPKIGQPAVYTRQTGDQRNGSFVIDMRTSRLGLNVMGPKVLGADTKANIEIDFWGSSAPSASGARQGIPMIRHGYGQFDWKTDLYAATLLFGQTWSLAMAMPAQPTTLTYVPFGENGNIFIREPMIMFGQKIGNNVFNVNLELACARVLSGADTGNAATNIYPGVNGTQPDDRGAGEASMLPGGRARLTFVIKPAEIATITLGGSGQYQWEKHGLSFANLADEYIWGTHAIVAPSATAEEIARLALYTQRVAKRTRSYMAQGFGKIEISLVTILGTYWRGQNLDSFTSGLGQGTVENLTCTKVLGVKMQGGYGQVQFDLRKVGPIPIMLVGGYGGSMKNNTRNIAKGSQLWNETIQGSVIWYLNDYIWAGFEYARHQTKWKGDLGSAIDHRYHTSVMFSF